MVSVVLEVLRDSGGADIEGPVENRNDELEGHKECVVWGT